MGLSLCFGYTCDADMGLATLEGEGYLCQEQGILSREGRLDLAGHEIILIKVRPFG